MTTYDPAWDMPTLNWQQQGSFEAGAVPPITEPDAGTQILLGPIAQEWMPYICGALDQLRNPSAWIVADDTHMYDTLRRVDTLLGLICGERPVCPVTEVRLQDCVLQTSTDGGTTWTDAPGWSAGFADCVKAYIPVPQPPPLLPAPPGQAIHQQACNRGGFLGTVIIQRVVLELITQMNNNVQLATLITDFINTQAEVFPDGVIVAQAVNDFYQIYAVSVKAHFTAASVDGTLWAAVTLAIYNAIYSTGYVTVANFPTVVANIGAITYIYPEVIAAITAFLTRIGAYNLMAAQNPGAFDEVDCSGAAVPYCWFFDLTANDGGYYNFYHSTYVAGVGVQSYYASGNNGQYLVAYGSRAAAQVGSVRLIGTNGTDKDASVFVESDHINPTPVVVGSGPFDVTFSIGESTAEILMGVLAPSSTTWLLTITAMQVNGSGTNPLDGSTTGAAC